VINDEYLIRLSIHHYHCQSLPFPLSLSQSRYIEVNLYVTDDIYPQYLDADIAIFQTNSRIYIKHSYTIFHIYMRLYLEQL
jgi:hypothetical protein